MTFKLFKCFQIDKLYFVVFYNLKKHTRKSDSDKSVVETVVTHECSKYKL